MSKKIKEWFKISDREFFFCFFLFAYIETIYGVFLLDVISFRIKLIMTTTTITTEIAVNSSVNTTLLANSTIGSTTSVLSTIVTTATTTILSSTNSSNHSTIYENCLLKYSLSTCRLAEFIRVLAYLFLVVSFLPQVIYLFNHGSRYISGISYMWIIIRVLGLTSLMIAHAFNWLSIFELIAIISAVAVFVQIFIYADNLHRQQKIVLLVSTVSTWAIGISLILLLRKHENFLSILGYLLLALHMLPQVC